MADKTELLNFLDKKVFHPVLNANFGHHSEKDRKELQKLQQRTEAQKARFHGYDSAERIIEMYKNDISSETERPANARLKDLGLPTLPDIREDFLKLVGK
jgi:hypothetical protein